jgi:hypothetical protein
MRLPARVRRTRRQLYRQKIPLAAIDAERAKVHGQPYDANLARRTIGCRLFADFLPVGSKLLVHHEGIHEAQRRMPEAPRQQAHFRKTVRLPRLDRALVGAHHEIELHGTEAPLPRAHQGMFKHQARNASALSLR